jgi:hypothetical protein
MYLVKREYHIAIAIVNVAKVWGETNNDFFEKCYSPTVWCIRVVAYPHIWAIFLACGLRQHKITARLSQLLEITGSILLISKTCDLSFIFKNRVSLRTNNYTHKEYNDWRKSLMDILSYCKIFLQEHSIKINYSFTSYH